MLPGCYFQAKTGCSKWATRVVLTVQGDLAELVDDGGGRCVQVPAEQRQLDDRELGLGDAQQPGRDVEVGQRDHVDLGDLGCRARSSPG